ncbi:hypothetical protein BC332_13480 [Capsicum chinense]|nr:hypothetical protein BC332_13480 [Capsicum chinense]
MQVVDEGNPGCSSNSHFREQNKVADALAKLGLAAMDFGTTHILFTPPPTVEALVQADNLGSSTLRSTGLNLINLVRRDVDTNNLNTTTTSVQGNKFVLVSGDFMGEWVETSKGWKWRSFTKVTIPNPVLRNSSYDEFVASVMQSGDLDCAPSDMVISYVMHLREKVNPTIINSDVRVLTYIIDADADGFRPILRINMVETSFEGPLNSSASPLRCSAVDDDLIDDDLNDSENDIDDTINMKNYSMHMEDF